MPIVTGIDADMDAYLAAPTTLAFWRKHRGLTQAELAVAAGLSQAFVAQIEGGEREGTVQALARIARALRVRIEDLLADE
ncbi:helix-turn-helix domain-containing protein [Rhodopila sp.]|uniref:helix-turn-helix domain-containing protein n=1 Tax=Rhodopila sp. TaxID=2480087 RepID=UPI002B59C9E0|nr:helix-turn-helix transcriptional regulator [Rhodopila sp.]HVZ06986.1 helix-turn-helix transcriptional regulator [Rhodopila sp.]